MENREIEVSQNRVQVGGLNLLDTNRRVTRSVARALENQIVGSIFTQIDTGIQHPVDFVPTDYFNRCTAKIFGAAGKQTRPSKIKIAEEISVSPAENSASFSQKIEELFEMSDESEARGSIPPEEQQPGGSMSATCGQSSATINVEQLSRLMAMMAQQGDVMAECMNEVRQVRDNMATLNTRVTDVET
ncbi:unnamed protein product [Ceratitis capitata]|uniref:(Mediterranean fruit fly) hypothetical protein n=1 Tax=Ceratitis capitata TaxID=7213 RepID=A0A811USA8_CERCA|nr:unnamed protein product [Ceratitis capitata]